MPGQGNSTYPIERRTWQDRRKSSFLGQLRGIIKFGNRRQLRRFSDRRKVAILDKYPNPLLVVVVAILVLSICDAVLTLILISNGASELNPFMNYLLKLGTFHLIVGKYVLTAASVFVLVCFIHYPFGNFKKPVPSILGIIALIFLAVIALQIYMMVVPVM